MFGQFNAEEAIWYSREEGIKEGIAEIQINNIEHMKSEGLSPNEIAKLLRIELDTVETIVMLLEKYPQRPLDEAIQIFLDRM